jgi:hypothetical protein
VRRHEKFEGFPDVTADSVEQLVVSSRFSKLDDRAPIDTQSKHALLEIIQKTRPGIHIKIKLLWGSQELQDTFTRWLLNEPDLPNETAGALLSLSVLHSELFNLHGAVNTSHSNDIWGNT